jgi:RNA recognition motif-containing protein
MSTSRLYVGGLTPAVTQSDILNLFQKFGNVDDVHIPQSFTSALPRTFAIVKITFSDEQSHERMKKLNGSIWKGGKIKIEPAKEYYLNKLTLEKNATLEAPTQQKAKETECNLPALKTTSINQLTATTATNTKKYLRLRKARSLRAVKVGPKNKGIGIYLINFRIK